MSGMELNAKERKNLLQLARTVLKNALVPASARKKQSDILDAFSMDNNRPAAVFVTLMEDGDLRGCIGTVEPKQPLAEAVASMTLQAAFEDPRFPPVSLNEIERISIEISLLSPMKKIESADRITPHEHGVLIRKGFRSGLFLPQVWEHFNDKTAFLNTLASSKAGLPKDAWKDPETELFIFTVECFREAEDAFPS
jgi:AmmeMemoRadiSam system protein A